MKRPKICIVPSFPLPSSQLILRLLFESNPLSLLFCRQNIRQSPEFLGLNSNDPAALKCLGGSRPRLWLVADHLLKELLKLLASESLLVADFVELVMELPELFVFSLHDEAVQLIVLRCELERQFAQHQSEEDHSQGKDIAFGGIVILGAVLLAAMDLRRHVALPRALVFRKPDHLLILDEAAGEPKIADLDIPPLFLKPYQYILQFEISMRNGLPMQVLNRPKHLPEDASLGCDVKLIFRDVLQQRSLLGILEDQDVIRACQLFIHFITHIGNILLVSKRFDDVLMLHRFQKKVFVFEVSLLLLVKRRYHLQDHPVLFLPVGVELGTASLADQQQLVLTHISITQYYRINHPRIHVLAPTTTLAPLITHGGAKALLIDLILQQTDYHRTILRCCMYNTPHIIKELLIVRSLGGEGVKK